MLTRSRILGLCVGAWLGVLGCATAPMDDLRALDPSSPEVGAALEQLQVLARTRTRLRAQARVSLDGAHGSSFARHLLMLERPNRLRLEILGLVGQRVAVLASDGVSFDLYRGETGRVERGAVYPELLGEVAGVPLAPDDLIALLLGIPPRDVEDPRRAERGADGRLALHFEERGGGRQRVVIDATGHVAAVALDDSAGAPLVAAIYEEPGGDEGFAQRIRLDFPSAGLQAEVEFRSFELEPSFPDGLFRLDLVSSPGG